MDVQVENGLHYVSNTLLAKTGVLPIIDNDAIPIAQTLSNRQFGCNVHEVTHQRLLIIAHLRFTRNTNCYIAQLC